MLEANESAIATALERHVRALASDEYEGRLPATKGDTLTVSYIVDEFSRIGLAPGASGGQFTQPVPLVSRSLRASLDVKGSQGSASFATPSDFVIRDQPSSDSLSVKNGDVVFAGYGLKVPRYGWDDYKNADVRGKIVLMLLGQPPLEAYRDSVHVTGEQSRAPVWDEVPSARKLSAALARGAAGVLFLHDSAAAGYPYQALIAAYGVATIALDTPRIRSNAPAVTGYLSARAAEHVVTAAGKSLDELTRASNSRTFTARLLPIAFTLRTRGATRFFTSPNVIGRIDGTDSISRREAVVYTAHWDHLGRDATRKGDQTYNGAVDNAGGVAQLIEIARAFTSAPARPRRTIYFIATTAEESGLLGASYYVGHPVVPMTQTVANINLDFFLPWGRTSDVIDYGPTGTTVDSVLAEVARGQGRSITPDPTPEEHYFQRGDQFPFAMAGVPAIFPAPGVHYVGKPDGYGKTKLDSYIQRDYHQVSDEVRSDWDYSGAVQDVILLARVGYNVAQTERRPTWNATTKCAACRERRN
jgi:Zn-dependent M28 family amino/carboxypeptidase